MSQMRTSPKLRLLTNIYHDPYATGPAVESVPETNATNSSVHGKDFCKKKKRKRTCLDHFIEQPSVASQADFFTGSQAHNGLCVSDSPDESNRKKYKRRSAKPETVVPSDVSIFKNDDECGMHSVSSDIQDNDFLARGTCREENVTACAERKGQTDFFIGSQDRYALCSSSTPIGLNKKKRLRCSVQSETLVADDISSSMNDVERETSSVSCPMQDYDWLVRVKGQENALGYAGQEGPKKFKTAGLKHTVEKTNGRDTTSFRRIEFSAKNVRSCEYFRK